MSEADETCRLAQYSSAAATPTSPHKAECTPVLQGEAYVTTGRRGGGLAPQFQSGKGGDVAVGC